MKALTLDELETRLRDQRVQLAILRAINEDELEANFKLRTEQLPDGTIGIGDPSVIIDFVRHSQLRAGAHAIQAFLRAAFESDEGSPRDRKAGNGGGGGSSKRA